MTPWLAWSSSEFVSPHGRRGNWPDWLLSVQRWIQDASAPQNRSRPRCLVRPASSFAGERVTDTVCKGSEDSGDPMRMWIIVDVDTSADDTRFQEAASV